MLGTTYSNGDLARLIVAFDWNDYSESLIEVITKNAC